MKFSIECDTREEYEEYYNGPKYKSILDDLKAWLRSELKYSQTRTEKELVVVSEIREKIYELCREEFE
jgi:hypothetical protein